MADARRTVLAVVLFLAVNAAATPARQATLASGATVAPQVPRAILLQADREARLAVAKKMAGTHPELLTAYQRLAAAGQPINDAQADVNKAQAAVNALKGPLQDAIKRVKEWQDTGYFENGTLWVTPNAKVLAGALGGEPQ